MAELSKEEIYKEYHGKVFGYFITHLRSPEDAEDLTADVFVKVYKALDGFDPSKASISTWIYTIARNICIDFLRKRKETSELPEELIAEDNIEGQVISQEELGVLAKALKKLPEEQRDIIVLHYYYNKPLTEITFLMGLSYSAVKTRHQKALETLRKNMI